MKTARTRLAFSVLIVFAMVSSGLGVGAMFGNGGTPAVSGPAGSLGTRSDGTPETISLSGTNMNEMQENLQVQTQQFTNDANLPYKALGHDEIKDLVMNAPTQENHIDAKIVQNKPISTRSFFDAGGPYGGPNCFEGSCTIHFEITTDDPTLIFFRWDFNDDGTWDTPWLTDMTYDMTFYDNYYGNVKAEGWDGISTQTFFFFGNNLNQVTNIYWYMWPLNTGWKFQAKADITATRLGQYVYWTSYPGINLRLWDFATQTELGRCTPPQTTYSWNWCTLATPINLVLGKHYMISEHMNYDYGYYVGFNNPAVPWDKVLFENFHYAWGLPQRFPNSDNGGGTTYVPAIDFEWRQTLIVPLTVQDKAFVDVNNVAPQPFDVTTMPSPALEGSAAKLTAKFNDPGTLDDWWYRWTYGDGTMGTWKKVNKYSGGAKVLIYHSISGNEADLVTKVTELCGVFCTQIDLWDFGPIGHNAHLKLADFMQYDVIYIAINYFPQISMKPLGDALADYQDQKGSEGSGGVVVEAGPMITGSTAITGRWRDEVYNPVPFTGYSYGSRSIGTIYVPGHPLLNGVTTLGSTFFTNTVYSVTSGATRIADWNDGLVLLATKLNPTVSNGARSVAMPFFAPWFYCQGSCHQLVVNALKWASRQPNPVLLTMPIQLSYESHVYPDDTPVTTSPQDDITVKVEVKDDDHMKVEGITTLVKTENFQDSSCYYPNFPAGWTTDPYGWYYGWMCYNDYYGMGSNAAVIWYWYNDYATSTLTGMGADLSAYNAAKLEWRQYWWADYGGGNQDGYVEASIDGGITFPYVIAEFHHNAPGNEKATKTADVPVVSNNMMFRFRYVSSNDWLWIVDDIKLYGTVGRVVWGLGETTGIVTIANVAPAIIGGPSSGLRDEAQSFTIAGMEITDPAILQPTEWFAYKASYDDGSPSNWVYKGTLAPPKQDVLIVHSLDFTGCGSGCMGIANMLNGMDLVGSVTSFNFFNYPNPQAPSLSYLLNFDVVILATNWAFLSFPPFDAARIAIGNNLADYLDAHAGGVLTMMFIYDLSPYYGDLFSIQGRFMDQKYGPFEPEVYGFGSSSLGVVHYPDHPVMKGVKDISLSATYSGDQMTTPGGLRLASNSQGGGLVGVKDFNNDGRRTCSINAYGGGYGGADAPKLMRQCIGWAIGGIPTPEIPPVTHFWGDNGLYTVDITLIDDDMGWTWDSVNNKPVADPTYAQTLAHHYIPVEVNNVDPTISNTAAYTFVDLCIRLSGNKGNSATLTVTGTDGSYYSVTTTRVPGAPQVACLPTIKIDMTPSTKYTFAIAYDPTGDDGANPEWIFQSTWPDGKIHELRHVFNSNYGPQVWTIGNKEFKALALDSPLTFEAMASDPGSDDLVFAWVWSDQTPYDLHIYAHPGVFYMNAASGQLDLLPFQEPRFNYFANDIRSPTVDPIRAHDTATHTFSSGAYFLYVMLIVADDDNGDPYSSPYLWPGMDLEVVQIDL